MDKKRLIFAILFIIVSILIAYALYKVFFEREVSPFPPGELPVETIPGQFPDITEGRPGIITVDPGELPISETIPGLQVTPTLPTERVPEITQTIEPNRFKKAVDINIKSPGIGKTTGARFYNDEDGRFYKLNADGTISPLSDNIFYNIRQATWSPTVDEAIIEYPDGANIYYNFESERQATLPKHWEDFSFAPSGGKVVSKSIGISPDNRWLISSNPDGSQINLIEPMGENQDKVITDWSPNQQVIALARTGASLGVDRQEILLVGQNKENFKSLKVEGRGLETKWSPEGKKLLHSVYSARSDFKPELWIVNAEGDNIGTNRKPLGVETWASKCAMADERYVYCGVPQELETGVAFAPELADTTRDILYKIDIQTGLKTIIPLEGFNVIDEIFVSPDKETIYFTNKLLSGLFQVDL